MIPQNTGLSHSEKINIFQQHLYKNLLNLFSTNPKALECVQKQGAEKFVSSFEASLNPDDLPTIIHEKGLKNEITGLEHPWAQELFPELTDVYDTSSLIAQIATLCHAKDSKGRNILHVAIERRDISLVKLAILFNPPLLFQATHDSVTPLTMAAEIGFTEALTWLIDPFPLFHQGNPLTQDIDINVKTNQGHTPLHKAIISGHLDTVQQLLALGADKRLEDACGMNAADWAYFQSCHFAGRTSDPLQVQKYNLLTNLVLTTKPLLPIEIIVARLEAAKKAK